MNKTESDDIKVNLIKKSLEKNKTDVYVPVERRKGIDGRLNFINLMCILLSGAILSVIALIIKAGKNLVYIQNNNLLWATLEFWNADLLKLAFLVNIVCMIMCMFCIILNFTRRRRRTDKIKKILIVYEVIGFIISVFLFVKLY